MGDAKQGIMRTVIIILVIMMALVIGFIAASSREPVKTFEELAAEGAILYKVPRFLPEFTLNTDAGETLTAESFKGQWSVLFFGFTYCPDICPTTMAVLKQWYEQLDPALAKDTQVYLVTVDPARDTAAKLGPYVDYFNPEFIGITGEFLDLHRFATALNVPFAKAPGSGKEDYLVDHGSSVAIIGPDGYFTGFWKPPVSVEMMAATYPNIRKRLERLGI